MAIKSKLRFIPITKLPDDVSFVLYFKNSALPYANQIAWTVLSKFAGLKPIEVPVSGALSLSGRDASGKLATVQPSDNHGLMRSYRFRQSDAARKTDARFEHDAHVIELTRVRNMTRTANIMLHKEGRLVCEQSLGANETVDLLIENRLYIARIKGIAEGQVITAGSLMQPMVEIDLNTHPYTTVVIEIDTQKNYVLRIIHSPWTTEAQDIADITAITLPD